MSLKKQGIQGRLKRLELITSKLCTSNCFSQKKMTPLGSAKTHKEVSGLDYLGNFRSPRSKFTGNPLHTSNPFNVPGNILNFSMKTPTNAAQVQGQTIKKKSGHARHTKGLLSADSHNNHSITKMSDHLYN